jgi:cytochrome oxidase Cu insertion factor (SCO1/SenC/PrrC family)
MSRKWLWPPLWIGLITAGPLLLAVLAHLGVFGSAPFAMLANDERELFDPPLAVPQGALRGRAGETLPADWARYRWSLIYAKMSPCEAQCGQDLEKLRQIHGALGRDQDRVQPVFLTAADTTDVAAAGFRIGRIDGAAGRALIEVLGQQRVEAGRLFVVDPLGNLVLSYPANADRRRVLDDLERLLDVSKVG